MYRLFRFLAIIALAGCAHHKAYVPPSQGHISSPPPVAAPSNIPSPITVPAYVPPPKPLTKAATYSVVVNEVPVKELLFALARDTKLNIDVHPGIQGVVSLNAIDEPLTAILERVSNQVNIRYKLEGNTLIVSPDTPYLHTYRVSYVNLSRNTNSTIGVATQIATTGTTTTQASGAGAQSGGITSNNSSTTTVNSQSNNNFWDVLSDNIRSILSSSKTAALTADEKAARMEAVKATRDERLHQAEAVSRAGAASANLFNTIFGNNTASASDNKNDVIINPVAGTVTILGSERQHKLVRRYLDGVMDSVQRQVLIEATIVEIALSDRYRAGIDWSILSSGAGFRFTQSMLAGNLSTPPAFTIGYANATSKIGNISATLSLLESFGNTRVLSSPKLMALNNQTALLKVVNNVVYFSIDVQPATTSSAGSIISPSTFSSVAHTVPVGVVMAVTPQISDSGLVSLTVRPTISRVLGFKNDPNPSLGSGATRINNPVPEIQVREMESVLQVNSGQTVILGGLMQDDVVRNRDGIPVLSDLPTVGDLLSYRDETAAKTELVIFLRSTIITNPSLESNELEFYKRYLPTAQVEVKP